MNLAWRNLVQDKTRALLSVLGVALAIMLILVLTGFVSGLELQVTRYLDNTPGSVVLVPAGTRGSSLVVPPQSVPAQAVEQARSVPGVAAAFPVVSQYAVLDLGQSKQFVTVIGYDPAAGGGPWSLRAGRLPQSDAEVVLDGVLADRRGVRVGDTFGLMGQTFVVAGLSEGTTTWMMSYVFMRLDAAQRLFGNPGTVSMVLVEPAAGVSPAELRDRLAAIQGTDAVLKSDLVAATRNFYLSAFAAPLNLMAGIAALVGVLVVGMVVYTATVERQREYGVIKALGARNRVLYRVVGVQALVAALTGAIVGVGLAAAAAQLIMGLRPQFLITIEWTSVVSAFAAGLVMALAAALFPARLLGRLAPAEVFRR